MEGRIEVNDLIKIDSFRPTSLIYQVLHVYVSSGGQRYYLVDLSDDYKHNKLGYKFYIDNLVNRDPKFFYLDNRYCYWVGEHDATYVGFIQ